MDNKDMEKLNEAIHILVNDKLKIDADDTLFEKLCSYIEESSLSPSDCLLLLNEIEQSIKSREVEPINLTTAIRIYGLLINKEDLLLQEKFQLFTNLFVSTVSELMIDRNYSFQCAYFKCLNEIISNEKFFKWILTADINYESLKSFPELIFYFSTKSHSYFVQHEVIHLLKHLFEMSLAKIEEEPVVKFIEYFNNFASNLTLEVITVLDIALKMVMRQKTRYEIVKKFGIESLLVSKLDKWLAEKHDKIWLLCQLLGSCIQTKTIGDKVIQKLIANNELKGLIAFLTSILEFEHSYAGKWMVYCVYSLIAKYESNDLSNEFLSTEKERMFVDNLTDNSTISFCFMQIERVDLDYLSSRQLGLICEATAMTIKQNMNRKDMKKNVLKAFSVLEMLISQSFIDLVEAIMLIYIDLLSCVDESLKYNVLKGMKNVIENYSHPDLYKKHVIEKTLHHLDEIIAKTDIEEYDIIDTALENLNLLLKYQIVNQVNESLLTSFLSIWNQIKDNEDSELLPICISLLIQFEISLPSEDFSKLSFEKYKEVPSIITKYLNEGGVPIKQSIIEALKKSNYVKMNFECLDTDQFKNVCYDVAKTLCKVTISVTDDELQFEMLKLMKKIVDQNLQELISVGYYEMIYKLLHDDLLSEKVIILAEKMAAEIKSLWLQGNNNHIDDITFVTTNAKKLFNSKYNINEDDNAEAELVQAIQFIYNRNEEIQIINKDIPVCSVVDDIINSIQLSDDILIDCY